MPVTYALDVRRISSQSDSDVTFSISCNQVKIKNDWEIIMDV